MKSEKGSITLFVLISMIFFLGIAMTAYLSASSKLQGQDSEISQIKASYEQDLSEEGLSTLYDKLTEEKTLISQITSDNYGDEINYGINIDNNDNGHINGWKIFYKNENGTYIIAADYVRTDNTALNTALQRANISKYTEDNSKLYSVYWPNESYLTKKNSNGEAIIDSNARNTFMFNWNRGGLTQNNKIAVASLLDTDCWRSFLTDGATMAIGSPTIEMIRESWNEKKYTDSEKVHKKIQIKPDAVNGYGYYMGIGDDENITTDRLNEQMQEYNYLTLDAGYNDKLYFPHTESAKWNNLSWYWLASPSSWSEYPGNTLAGVSKDGSIHANSKLDESDKGIRPVVFLPSEINATQDYNGVWQIIKH